MRTFPEVPQIKWRKHRSAKAIVRAFGHSNVPPRQLVREVLGMGCWAFADTRRRIVHWWSDGKRTEAELLHLFAHELGHNLGKPNRRSVGVFLGSGEFEKWLTERWGE